VKSNKNIKKFLACLNRLLLILFHYVLSTINIRKANIMKLQFERCWSTIPTITHKKINKIRTTISNIKLLNTKITKIYGVGNSCPGVGQSQECSGV
jgi:hypothetical protein